MSTKIQIFRRSSKKVGVSPTLVISCLVAMSGPFWFNCNLWAVFIDGQGSDPVFRERNSGSLGYPCVALVTTKRGWASSLPTTMDDQSLISTQIMLF